MPITVGQLRAMLEVFPADWLVQADINMEALAEEGDRQVLTIGSVREQTGFQAVALDCDADDGGDALRLADGTTR